LLQPLLTQMTGLQNLATERKPLSIIAPIDISNWFDVNLKFVTSALFKQTFQCRDLIAT
jgi:hypothetical protein